MPPAGENVTLRRATRSALPGRRPQRPALQHLREHDAHLHLRERRPEAAPHAAAERDPRVRRRRAVEEALGPERERLGIAVRARVREPDRRRDVGARRQDVAVDAQLLGQPAPGERHDRPQAQRLRSRRRAGTSSPARLGVEPLERGGWRSSRSNVQARPVAVVSWPASSSVMSWSRISASSIGSPSSKRAATSSERMSSPRIGRAARRSRSRAARRSRAAAPRSASASRAADGAISSTPNWSPTDEVSASRRASRSASRVAARRVGDAEHRAQDHLERDRLHPRVQRERLARRPRARRRARPPRARSTRTRACARRGTAAASACAARGARGPRAAAPTAAPTIGSSASVRPGGSPCSRSV